MPEDCHMCVCVLEKDDSIQFKSIHTRAQVRTIPYAFRIVRSVLFQQEKATFIKSLTHWPQPAPTRL